MLDDIDLLTVFTIMNARRAATNIKLPAVFRIVGTYIARPFKIHFMYKETVTANLFRDGRRILMKYCGNLSKRAAGIQMLFDSNTI